MERTNEFTHNSPARNFMEQGAVAFFPHACLAKSGYGIDLHNLPGTSREKYAKLIHRSTRSRWTDHRPGVPRGQLHTSMTKVDSALASPAGGRKMIQGRVRPVLTLLSPIRII